MGRKTCRRKRRTKTKRSSGRSSDPEHKTKPVNDKNAIIDDDQSCWDSLDELALADYTDNVGKYDSTFKDEMDMAMRLSFLNVSSENVNLPEESIATSDTELPQSEQRYSRKRISKRNRKRTKKFKADPNLDSYMGSGEGCRTRRVSGGLSKLCTITWMKSMTDQSVLMTDDSQTGGGGGHFDTSDDTSSRGLTESDSPIIDDIIMIDNASSSEGVTVMEGQEVSLTTHSSPSSSFPTPSTPLVTNKTNNNLSESKDESEISSTTSDSGCDGDDEESSVEISKLVSSSNRGGHSTSLWLDTAALSSADEMNEDEIQFQQILKGSFPLMSQRGKCHFKNPVSNSFSVDRGNFKHPQSCGIPRGGTYKRLRKKPSSSSSWAVITSPRELCQKVTEFIGNQEEPKLQLPKLSRSLCHMTSKLAQVHHLEFVMPQQKKLLPVAAPLLRKTSFTSLASKLQIEEIIQDYERTILSPPTVKKETQKEKVSLSVRVPLSNFDKKTKSPTTDSPLVVGGDAPPINDTNIGSVMLRGMGWTPGRGLGAQEDGICAPLCASRRPKNVGLGYT